MEFRAKGSDLLEGFQLAASVVGPKATREVTRNTKLVARKGTGSGEISIFAVGEETSVTFRFEPSEVIEEGEVVLPGETLVGVLREVRGEEVRIKVSDCSCEIRMENSFFKVLGEDPASFPEEMTFEDEGALTIPGATLKSMLSRIIFAASTEDTRYAMNGILFSMQDGEFDLVATDGRRLAFVQSKIAGAQKCEPVIVPRVSITHALKVLGAEGADEVRVAISENQFALESSRGVLFSRLIDGKFPPYRDVIPKNTSFTIEFPIDSLAAAVRQASLLTDPASKTVKFTFEGDSLEISSRTADKGEARIKVPVEYGREEAFTVYFNPDFIADCLKALDADTVSFSFTDAAHQAMVTDGAGFVYIIMPVTPS